MTISIKQLIACMLFFLFFAELKGQVNTSNTKWMEYIEELTEESEDNTEQIESLFNDLSYLSEHPLNLNTITYEQLAAIPFLSDLQILNILDYRKIQSEFVSIYELKNIKFMDLQTVELILPFVYAGEKDKSRAINFKNLIAYGKNEAILRYDKTMEEKKGYKEVPDSVLDKYPNRKYSGEPFYTSLRYSYTFENKIQAGLVAEKDAGEAFRNERHKGYDYYSAHLLLRNMGVLSTLVIGDYKTTFGQGLIISNDFNLSRSSVLSQPERKNYGFRRHYSTNENDFFRGIASTITIKNIDISAFFSYRNKDGNVTDSLITSFKTDGYHRTEDDLEKKNNISISTFGGNIRYADNNYTLGITALTTYFGNLSVDPEPHPYNRFYFRGERNTNVGIDYSLNRKQVKIYGETAMSQNGAIATLNALKWNISSDLNSLILYRYYDYKYQAFYGNSFSQSSTIQNEEGLFLSLQWAPIRYWRFTGYADFFRFPWLKYGIDAPSTGKEYMVQGDFTGIKNTIITCRYRFRQKDNNLTQSQEVDVVPADLHRVKVQLSHTLSENLSVRSIIESCFYENISSSNKGWAFSQSASWSDNNSLFQIDLYAAYFNTDDYNCRIYSNEKNMLYSFYSPAFYGEGIRISSVVRYNITPRLYFCLKGAWVHYYDRDVIGSNLEEIEGKNKTDLYALVRWKF
jgi:hypothetical protein